MTRLQFGFCVPIFANPGVGLFRTPRYPALDAATTMELACVADKLGYDSLWVADHLMLGKDEAILEGWTTLSALAGATRTAKLGMIHQANLLRHPALGAKMAATLDQISGGRLIHFFDCGNQRREHVAYGLSWSESAEDRIARMVEGLQLTLALWTTEGPVDFVGAYYTVTGAVCAPSPVQRPHPPIWLGEAHPAMLQACARYAQGWNSVPVAVAELRRRLEALATTCEQVGRPYSEIEKTLEMQILVVADRATLRRQLREMVELAPAGQAPDAQLAAFLAGASDELPDVITETWIAGTPDEVERRIRAYADLGVTHFMLWFVDAPRQDGMRLFAEQVAPRFDS
jgi:alkanesulfonate monooxygenase SsuD/methylene tetrahydromethanopterin reductase-like flavin-dependent oxidoreductase (luciferase family)